MGPNRILKWCSALSLLVSSAVMAQRTIHVPAEIPTIQEAIVKASDGDTVLVAPGSYFENLDFLGKTITVTSGAKSYMEAATTILNGVGMLPTVRFNTREPRSAVLNGFTIENSQASAIYMGASATVSNNSIINNPNCAVVIVGANASPLIRDNRIAGNLYQASVTCSFDALGVGNGAAVQVGSAGSDVVLSGNLIENNSGATIAGSVGAAVTAMYTPSLTLNNNIIRDNIGATGTGLYVADTPKLVVMQNLIYSNEARVVDPQGQPFPGGNPGVVTSNSGSAVNSASYQITDNTIVGNYAYGDLSYGGKGGGEQLSLGEELGDVHKVVSVVLENNLLGAC